MMTIIKANTLLTITSVYKSMTRTEQKIADSILEDPDKVLYSTLTDLAENVGVGETSVLRFCRKIGFKGYQDFKLSIAQQLATPVQSVHSEIEETDSILEIAQKITTANSEALDNTLSLLDMIELQKAIDAIVKTNKIYFFGIGSSAITAADGKYRFMRLGFNVEAVTDSHVMAMTATLMEPNDVVFGVSISGSTKDIVDAIEIAKRNQAFVICLTGHARSPITKYADAVLLTKSRETPLQGGAFSSKIAQIHLLDILSTATAIACKEKAYESIKKTAEAVTDKLY